MWCRGRGSATLQRRLADLPTAGQKRLKRTKADRRKLLPPTKIPHELGGQRWVPVDPLWFDKLKPLDNVLPKDIDFTFHPSEYKPTTLQNLNPKIKKRLFPNKATRQIEFVEDYGDDCTVVRTIPRPEFRPDEEDALYNLSEDEIFAEYQRTGNAWWAEDRIRILHEFSKRFKSKTDLEQRNLLESQPFKTLVSDLYEDVEIRRVSNKYAPLALLAMVDLGLSRSKIMDRLYAKTSLVVGNANKEQLVLYCEAAIKLAGRMETDLLNRIVTKAWHFRREFTVNELILVARCLALLPAPSRDSRVLEGIAGRLRVLYWEPHTDPTRQRMIDALENLGVCEGANTKGQNLLRDHAQKLGPSAPLLLEQEVYASDLS